jgi:hypothetical protein
MIRPAGSNCPYKKLICTFDGDCLDCAVWKERELILLQKGEHNDA